MKYSFADFNSCTTFDPEQYATEHQILISNYFFFILLNKSFWISFETLRDIMYNFLYLSQKQFIPVPCTQKLGSPYPIFC